MKRSKKTTLKDIASQAGCSTQAVSSILNSSRRGNAHFSKDLRERVHGIAKKLNYRPPPRKVSKRLSEILLVFEYRGISDKFMLDVVKAASDVCNQWDCRADYCCLDEGLEEIAARLEKDSVEGVIVIHSSDQELMEFLDTSETPCLFVNPNTILDANCILHDDEEGIRTAVAFLACLDVQQIAYVGAYETPHHSARLRREELMKHADSCGIGFVASSEAGCHPFQQMAGILEESGEAPLVVVGYNSVTMEQTILAHKPQIQTKKIDFFSLDGPDEFSFAYLDLQRREALRTAVETVLLRAGSRNTEVANLSISERLCIQRRPFSDPSSGT